MILKKYACKKNVEREKKTKWRDFRQQQQQTVVVVVVAVAVTSQFCVPIYADGFLLLIIEKLFIHFVQMPPVVIRKLSTINHCKEIYETVQR
ncbi:hypothetical protein T02_212 [Trichinella nativa]|uniref:Uncharacterized protein n=1 Tax=Trichinella nativa TaxID=6335 RepID=A0A0V1LBG8_9BILA|nr:hypothetical protein T02_212 [Trichinella nativa]